MQQLREVSSKLEALDDYIPKSGHKQTKTVYIPRRGNFLVNEDGTQANLSLSPKQPQQYQVLATSAVDGDGDITMTGVNALVSALVNAFQNSKPKGMKEGNCKPRAPWRSQEDFDRLKAQNKSIRCGKSGHFGSRCTDFSAAVQPAKVSQASTMSKQASVGHMTEDTDLSENK